MKKHISLAIFSVSFWALSAPLANAHVGHVGELAGHGHWVGAGALLGAAALGAWLAKTRKNKKGKPSTEVKDDAKPQETPVEEGAV